MPSVPTNSEQTSDWTVFRRTLIVIGTIGFALALWRISDVLLLAFAAVLFAILLRAAARPLALHTGLSDGLALGVTVFLIVCLFVGTVSLFGATISSQLSDLSSRLPSSVKVLEEQAGINNLFQQIWDQLGSSSFSIFQSLTNVVRSLVNAAADTLVLIIASIFIAVKPSLYRRGVLLLFPKAERRQLEKTFDHIANALEQWLFGQLISMVLVGILMAIALSIIGLPSPFALALIAGVAEFIPLLGPILGGILPLIVAFGEGSTTVLWTLVVIVVIQQIESNMITPIVQRRIVSLPPALTLFAVFVFGALFGVMGLLFATPLTVVGYVAITDLYVREALGEDVAVPGEKDANPTPAHAS